MSIRGSFAISAFSLIVALGAAAFRPATAHAQSFQPAFSEELKMTSEPLAPGAPAVILYRQVDRDDNGRTSHEDNYVRVKILTEAGRKQADVEIPFVKGSGRQAVRKRDWNAAVERFRTILHSAAVNRHADGQLYFRRYDSSEFFFRFDQQEMIGRLQ